MNSATKKKRDELVELINLANENKQRNLYREFKGELKGFDAGHACAMEEVKVIVDALELIKDKAPWCECMNTAAIAAKALSKFRGNNEQS
jgi:hypothetical protein